MLGLEEFAFGSRYLRDCRVVFHLVVTTSMAEYANVIPAYDIRTIPLVAHCKLRVLLPLDQRWGSVLFVVFWGILVLFLVFALICCALGYTLIL